MSNPEVELYIEELAALRAEMLKHCEGLSAEALNWKPPVKDTNTLYQLITHVTGSDGFWLLSIIGGIDVKRDRAAEFTASGNDLSAVRALIESNAARSNAILRKLTLDDLARVHETNLGARDGRWCIMHIVEHWSRHVGHAELTRQLWEAMGKAA
jgi:uncharacterized damage-inducible protein DinB